MSRIINTIKLDETTINIMDSSCQFNVTEAKDFRTTMAKWHNADFDMAQEIAKKNDLIKDRTGSIKTNEGLIDDLKAGKKIIGNKTEKDLLTQIEEFKKDIEDAKKLCTELNDVSRKRLDDGLALVTNDLYDAYVKYCDDKQVEDTWKDYYNKIAIFLHKNGVVPCDATILALIGAVGSKVSSVNQKIKNGKHNTANPKATYKKVFLGELCDIMQKANCLPKKKFEYIPKKLREEQEKAKKER